MKYIAIFSEPQECGNPTLDILSLETGEVVESYYMTGYNSWSCYIDEQETVIRELGEEVVIKDTAFLPANEAGNPILPDLHIGTIVEDPCAEYDIDCVVVADPELKIIKQGVWTAESLKVWGCKPWHVVGSKWIYAEINLQCRRVIYDVEDKGYVYHPEEDLFGQYMTSRGVRGLEFPTRKDMSLEEIIKHIASSIGYNIVNILYY